MKFRVGQKVRIKKHADKIKNFSGGFIDDMVKYLGKVYTINYINVKQCGYRLEGNGYFWDERALEPADYREVHITTNGYDEVCGVLKKDGKVIKKSNILFKINEFNFESGAKNTFERLLKKRTADSGDYIIITNTDGNKFWRNGDIFKVRYRENNHVSAVNKYGKSAFCILDDEYEILENYHPPMFLKNKYGTNYGEVGLEINLTDECGRQLHVGDVVEIFDEEFRSKGLHFVCFDDYYDGFVFSIAVYSSTKFNNGEVIEGWKIIKRSSYGNVNLKECLDGLTFKHGFDK